MTASDATFFVLFACLLFGLPVGLLVYGIKLTRAIKRFLRTAVPVTGTTTDIETGFVPGGRGGSVRASRFKIRFATPDGQTHEFQKTLIGWLTDNGGFYEEGTSIDVLYDPANITDARLKKDLWNDVAFPFIFGGMFLLFLFIIGSLILWSPVNHPPSPTIGKHI